MFKKMVFVLSMCNVFICSDVKKEDIVLGNLDGHHNHWGAEVHMDRSYNEQRREKLPEALIHNASTSIASQRTDRGIVDIPGATRVVSDDSLADGTPVATPVINVAATIAVKTEAECCNSRCCIDEDVKCNLCTIQ